MPSKVVYQDENGNFYPLATFPTQAAPGPATYVSAPVSGTLVDHGLPSGAEPVGVDTAVTDGATNTSDPGQVTVPVVKAPAKSDLPIVGTPGVVKLDGTVSVPTLAPEG
jgi:hypothetical protein